MANSMMESSKNLSERLRNFRVSSGCSQELFAEYLNISVRTVRYWEAGTYRPRKSKLNMICSVFGTSLNSILQS